MIRHVGRDRPRPADARDLPVLDRPEDLGLRPWRHVADLVEEERAAIGQLPLSLAVLRGAREGALHVPEELALDEVLGNGRAVDLDERAGGAGRSPVEAACGHLLADAALAGDENARIRGAGPADLLAQAGHRGPFAEERLLLLQPLPLPRHLAGEDVALASEAASLERPLERQEDPLERERLLEEVVGAAFDRLDRRLHRPVPRDHHDRQVMASGADLVEDGKAVDVGEPDVEEEGAGRGAARLGEPAEDRRSVLELLHAIPLVAEDLGESSPDSRRVVADEHRHPPAGGAQGLLRARGVTRPAIRGRNGIREANSPPGRPVRGARRRSAT